MAVYTVHTRVHYKLHEKKKKKEKETVLVVDDDNPLFGIHVRRRRPTPGEKKYVHVL